MRHEQDGNAGGGQASHRAQHSGSLCRRDRGGGLIEEDQRGALRKRAQDRHQLPVAYRQIGYRAVRIDAEADLCAQFFVVSLSLSGMPHSR